MIELTWFAGPLGFPEFPGPDHLRTWHSMA
jgi:hypothetical protein